MGSFGEDLRRERISRGVALEEITDATKISQRHLVALEQEQFSLLPGGILSKGIVRGYAGVLGLDPTDWTERFLKASSSAGETDNDDGDWTAFATNVGKARLLKHEADQMRLRWIGVAVLIFVVLVAGFLTVRYYGVRAGWWSRIIPSAAGSSVVHAASHSLQSVFVNTSLKTRD